MDGFPAMLQAWDWLAGLLLCEKGPGGPAGHDATRESAGLHWKVYSQQSTESPYPPSLITL